MEQTLEHPHAAHCAGCRCSCGDGLRSRGGKVGIFTNETQKQHIDQSDVYLLADDAGTADLLHHFCDPDAGLVLLLPDALGSDQRRVHRTPELQDVLQPAEYARRHRPFLHLRLRDMHHQGRARNAAGRRAQQQVCAFENVPQEPDLFPDHAQRRRRRHHVHGSDASDNGPVQSGAGCVRH